jgi:tetratricopeptide (TPR) repeat protein
MVYVIAELRNYRQLVRLRSDVLAGVEAGLGAAMGARGIGAAPGLWLAALGGSEAVDAAAAAGSAVRVRDFLASRRREIFGFAVAVAALSSLRPKDLAEEARRLLQGATEDEQLWIAESCAETFAAVLVTEAGGTLHKVTGHRRETVAEGAPRERGGPWVREALVTRGLDIISPRLNGGESRVVLFAHGPAGAGKTALLGEIARRIQRGNTRVSILRLRTIFKRRSPLHPVLGSLDPEMIAAAPRRLRGPERTVWDEVGRLLSWLVEQRASDGAPREDLIPDHLLEDFGIGYGLYLLAWTRMAEELLQSAVLVCDDVDSYHPSARRLLARVVDDMLARPSFLPLFSASAPGVPLELSGLSTQALFVHPLGRREIRSLSQFMYPGLGLPASAAHHLRRRAGGLPVNVIFYLHYLHRLGHIALRAGSWTWVPPADGDALLPSHPLSVSWYLVRSLHGDSFLLLYSLYLAGGLLDRDGIFAFLSEAGFDPAAAARSIAGFAATGLMEDEEALIPRSPALRKKLEELLGAEAAALRDRFVAHIAALWNAGRYRHPVLLFTFLARSGRTELALRILPDIIRRKLDENDPAGARVFCDARTLEFSIPPTAEEARQIAAGAAIGRLRAALLEDDQGDAELAEVDVRKILSSDPRGRLRGEAHSERGKFSLARGESLAGLDELKQGLLSYQESRDERGGAVDSADRGERACHLWLGAAMLAEGRIGEAVEYLGLSQRLCHEAGDAPGELWTAVYLATCLFVDGRFTQCFSVMDQALEAARTLYRRDVELFLLFLKARTLFQVGTYDEASLTLQACLCVATLYGIEPALPVIRAWLGRTILHGGELSVGIRLLESLPPKREVLLFLAEGALFSGDLENASLYAERGIGRPSEFRFPPPEAVSWRDGFASVEGRCYRLSRGDAFVQRTLAGLRAYLQGLRGFAAEGIRELHQLTRGEKSVDVDPSAYWFHYLYSQVLPEAGGEEVDDKGTILSKALKSLQERASRIDGPAQRSSFLWRGRWNRLIMEEARERKLL